MYKLTLTKEQQGCFLEFLKSVIGYDISFLDEWSEDYIEVGRLSADIDTYLVDGVLTLDRDQYTAVFNFLVNEVNVTKDDQLGKDLFEQLKDLFLAFYSLEKSVLKPGGYIDPSYEITPVESIMVNPLDDPMNYIPEHLKTNQI